MAHTLRIVSARPKAAGRAKASRKTSTKGTKASRKTSAKATKATRSPAAKPSRARKTATATDDPIRPPGPKSAGSKKRMPAAMRRASILFSFINETVRQGSVERVSLRAVAEGAGCTTPIVYRLFENRAGLVREAVRVAVSSELEWLVQSEDSQQLSPMQRLLAAANLLEARGPGDSAVFAAIVSIEARVDPFIAADMQREMARDIELMRLLFQEGVRLGEFKPDLDCEYAAWRVMEILAFRTHLHVLRQARPAEIRFLRRSFDALLVEICTSPPGGLAPWSPGAQRREPPEPG